jgi:hypothetical protein
MSRARIFALNAWHEIGEVTGFETVMRVASGVEVREGGEATGLVELEGIRGNGVVLERHGMGMD